MVRLLSQYKVNRGSAGKQRHPLGGRVKSEFSVLYYCIIVSVTHHIPETGVGKPNGCSLPLVRGWQGDA